MGTMAVATNKKKPTTEAHDEKRLEIIQACANLFDKVGYHHATMQMLADEVGLGKPTLYHYFRSKTAILYEMHQLHMDALLGGLKAHTEAKLPASEALKRACADILRQIAEHPGYVRAFMDYYNDLDSDMRKKIRQRRQEYFVRICEILQQGVGGGEFVKCDVELTAYAFLGMCNWAYKWYPPMCKSRPPAQTAEALCSVFIDGIRKT